MRTILAAAMTAAVLLTAVACDRRAGMSEETHARMVEQWRAGHEESYRRNWVSIAGLHFLEPGVHTAGSAAAHDIVLTAAVPETIGRFVVEADRVRFEPEPGVPVLMNGEPIPGIAELRDTSDAMSDELAIGGVRLVAHRSGERLALRVWDPDGELARGFAGFTWFDIDPAYHVTGRFIPDPQPRTVRVPNTFGDIDTYTTDGVVEFALLGQTLRLRPFTTRPNRFFFVFRDASSGEETYEAARFLYADLRDDGTVVLDFNEAYNPPCAFNPFTTCPIPLRENVLPLKVLAGEQAYRGTVEQLDISVVPAVSGQRSAFSDQPSAISFQGFSAGETDAPRRSARAER